MVEDYDKSVINSLGGFVFQIDVFILNALKLKPNETIEYESVDDVSIRKKEELDEKEDSFKRNLISFDSHQVIQVKRKEITSDVAERVLMNWLLLENSSINITKYILWGDASYRNACDIREIKIKDLFNKIRKTTDRSKKSVGK